MLDPLPVRIYAARRAAAEANLRSSAMPRRGRRAVACGPGGLRGGGRVSPGRSRLLGAGRRLGYDGAAIGAGCTRVAFEGDQLKTRLGVLAAIVGGLLAMLSSPLPWMTTTTSTWTLTIDGLCRGGVVALPMGGVVAIAGISYALG